MTGPRLEAGTREAQTGGAVGGLDGSPPPDPHYHPLCPQVACLRPLP